MTVHPPHSFDFPLVYLTKNNPSFQFHFRRSCRVTYFRVSFLYQHFILCQRFTNALYIHYHFHYFGLLIYDNPLVLDVVIQAFPFSIF